MAERLHLVALPSPAETAAYGTRSDDDLMLLARGGDRPAFAALVGRHETRAFGLALRITADETVAADAVQDAFVDLLRALPTYKPQEKFSQFLYRIVLNRCRMVLRSTRTRSQAYEQLRYETPTDSADELLARERERELLRSLSQLQPRQRELLALRFFSDLKHDEIATLLDVPAGTVKSRLHTALAQLREVHGLGPKSARDKS